ncbi:MAG: thioredoxin-like domain-containing protein [Flavobacteriales bacterium]
MVAKTAIRKKDFLPIYKKFKYKFNEVNCFEETKFFGVAKNQVKTNDIFDPEKILPDYFRFKSIAKKNLLTPFEKGDTIDLKKIYKEINSLKKLKESDFKKHVFYSWFYHCHACKKILPDLKSTANAIQKNNYNINIIGINPMDGKKLFERYQKENSINFNNYIVDRDWFYSTFKSSLFPTIYIVDSNGRILNAYHGNKKNIKSKILGDHKQ